MENKRRKTESSFDHSKTKAQIAYQQQLAEMHNLKVRLGGFEQFINLTALQNTYLINVNVTNKQKNQYYFNYIPEVLDV